MLTTQHVRYTSLNQWEFYAGSGQEVLDPGIYKAAATGGSADAAVPAAWVDSVMAALTTNAREQTQTHSHTHICFVLYYVRV